MTEKVYGSYAFTADVVANLPATPSTAAGNLDAYFATDTYALFLGVAGVWSAAVLPSTYAVTTSSLTLIGTGLNASLTIEGDAGSAINSRRCSNDTVQPQFFSYKARGTIASPLVIATSDFIGAFNAAGYDGAAYQTMSRFRFKYIGATPATDWETSWSMDLAKAGATVVTNVITIDWTNGVQFGPARSLNVTRITTFTTGQSKTFNNNIDVMLVVVTAATIAAATIIMPPAPVPNQEVTVCFGNLTVTALTVSGNTGQSVDGVPLSAAAGSFLKMLWDATSATWYRVG